MKENMRSKQCGKLQNYCGRATENETESSEGATQKLDLGLKCIYVNARSIVNKMDYLTAETEVKCLIQILLE